MKYIFYGRQVTIKALR